MLLEIGKTMKFKVGKTYLTRDGNKVRIVCDDRKGTHPVVGIISKGSNDKEEVVSFTEIGYYHNDDEKNELDLIKECRSFWDDVKRGTPVLVRDSCKDEWELKLFSEYKANVPYVEDGWDKFYTLDSSTYIQKIGYMVPTNIKLIENKNDRVLVNAVQLLGLIENAEKL